MNDTVYFIWNKIPTTTTTAMLGMSVLSYHTTDDGIDDCDDMRQLMMMMYDML
jgi:hypothetical protein